MKCPKCDYLGFDTGDRCKNCGYDFSLIAAPTPDTLRLDAPGAPVEHTPTTKYWLDQLDAALSTRHDEDRPLMDQPLSLTTPVAFAPISAPPAPPAPVSAATEVKLPLFRPPDAQDDDEPLIKLPATPRAPLAVRKTPEIPRLRAVPKPLPRVDEPVLQFADDVAPAPAPTPAARPARTSSSAVAHAGASTAGARLGAAAIDHAILFAIDAAVIYFTLRMTALPFDGWRMLPPAPLAAFLLLLKFAYFYAFTAVGGQTIGKMALGIRVVGENNAGIDGACALRRTLAGFGTLALLHDRIAHTRVVSLHSA